MKRALVAPLYFASSKGSDERVRLIAEHVAHRWRLPRGQSLARFECPYPVELCMKCDDREKDWYVHLLEARAQKIIARPAG